MNQDSQSDVELLWKFQFGIQKYESITKTFYEYYEINKIFREKFFRRVMPPSKIRVQIFL